MSSFKQTTLRILALGVGLACALGVSAATVLGQVLLDQPGFFYEFSNEQNPFDPGDFQFGDEVGRADAHRAEEGDLEESYTIQPPPPLQIPPDPHLEAYADASGTTFWTSALSPNTPFPTEEGWNIGGKTELRVRQLFRKDSPDASFKFTITQMSLYAFGDDDASKDNEGLFGSVVFDIDTTAVLPGPDGEVRVDEFTSVTMLQGDPGAYFVDSLGADLGADVKLGDTDQEMIEVALSQPYEGAIDLSRFHVGDAFIVDYTMQAIAIDDIQQDTTVRAFGRDPLDPDSGLLLTYDGVTPIFSDPVPPDMANVILSPVAVLDSGLGEVVNQDAAPENMINQSGLSTQFVSGQTFFDDYLPAGDEPLADDDYNNYWQSESADEGQLTGNIDFDLGDMYTVDRLSLWNGTLDEGRIWAAESRDGPWQEVADFSLRNNNPLLYALAKPEILEFDESVDARYLRLEVNSVHPFPSIGGFTLEAAIIREIAASVQLTATLPGDLSGNGVLDSNDVDLLAAHIRGGGTDGRYDVNQDGDVNAVDLAFWVHEMKGTYIGDANLDDEFNSGDLVALFTAGEYEDEVPMNSTWATGDFNGDSEFGTGDLVAAFTDGGYEQGPRTPAAVPEPSAGVLMLIAVIGLVHRSRRESLTG